MVALFGSGFSTWLRNTVLPGVVRARVAAGREAPKAGPASAGRATAHPQAEQSIRLLHLAK